MGDHAARPLDCEVGNPEPLLRRVRGSGDDIDAFDAS